MKEVRQYESADDFNEGITTMRNNSYLLQTWQMVACKKTKSGYVIVAVFAGR